MSLIIWLFDENMKFLSLNDKNNYLIKSNYSFRILLLRE